MQPTEDSSCCAFCTKTDRFVSTASAGEATKRTALRVEATPRFFFSELHVWEKNGKSWSQKCHRGAPGCRVGFPSSMSVREVGNRLSGKQTTLLQLCCFSIKSKSKEENLPVADACATIAPAATPNGFCAAPKAMVVKKERSPNSAAKTKENVCRIKAL